MSTGNSTGPGPTTPATLTDGEAPMKATKKFCAGTRDQPSEHLDTVGVKLCEARAVLDLLYETSISGDFTGLQERTLGVTLGIAWQLVVDADNALNAHHGLPPARQSAEVGGAA